MAGAPTPDLFGAPASEAPVFCAPAGEGCGPYHVPAGEVGGAVVCVAPGLVDVFRQPVAHVRALAEEGVARERRDAERHHDFLMGMIHNVQRDIHAGRLRSAEEPDGPPAEGPLADASETDVTAFRLSVMFMLHLIRDEGLSPRDAATRLHGREREAMALGYQRRDELFNDPESDA